MGILLAVVILGLIFMGFYLFSSSDIKKAEQNLYRSEGRLELKIEQTNEELARLRAENELLRETTDCDGTSHAPWCREWASLVEQNAMLVKQNKDNEKKLEDQEEFWLFQTSSLRNKLDEISELYEECLYGDNCPPFEGTRHGDCAHCQIKQIIERSEDVPESSKYTPGPWSVSGGVGFPNDPPLRTRSIWGPTAPGMQSGYHVADARGPAADINAMLIAAAPKLLAACKHAAKICPSCSGRALVEYNYNCKECAPYHNAINEAEKENK